MFWSGNYIVVRELKCLLKEENVTLTQILEADDILQECKADNKALIQFLTRPDILAELITLITEEPPKNVELSSQYRHANIASEVLTSNLSMLRDRLSMDPAQMNRLCDFVDRDPPLNPLLASYFSKTIEMLLERSPKQDWYLHHIVSLHVLDIFKSRRDFLPNLLRHLSTSAISDTFKCFLHLGSPFNKIILEWLDEHQFLESLIALICGTYDPEEALAAAVTQPDATGQDQRDKLDSNHNAEAAETADTHVEVVSNKTKVAETNGESEPPGDTDAREGRRARSRDVTDEARAERVRCVAAYNAAALLCDIAVDAATVDPFNNEWYAGRSVAARLRGEEAVRRLLQGVFTSPPRARPHALVNACRLLLALLSAPPDPAPPAATAPPAAPDSGAEAQEESGAAAHAAVERAIAPHLPLLHHALLHPAPRLPNSNADGSREAGGEGRGEGGGMERCTERVGAARVSVAALVARLALSEVDDVPTALISLGTAGVLIDLLFRCPHNNFLHAQVCALVRNARANRRFSHRYTAHLIEECNLLTRLMDAFEENEEKKAGAPRAGYMGHVVAALRSLDAAPPVLASALQQRWDAFREHKLRPLLQRHDTPLGGIFPWENNMYEVGASVHVMMDNMDNMADTLEDSYDFNETAASLDEGAEACEPLAEPLDEQMEGMRKSTKNDFLQLLNERVSKYDDEMWDNADAPQDDSPWEGAGAGGGGGGGAGAAEGWAQFDAFAEPPADPFAPRDAPLMQAMSFWANSASQEQTEFEGGSQNTAGGGFEDDDKDALTLLLAQKMLTAFQSMGPGGGGEGEGEDDFPLPRDLPVGSCQDMLQQVQLSGSDNPDVRTGLPEDSNRNQISDNLEATDVQKSSSNQEVPEVQNPQSDIREQDSNNRDPQSNAQGNFDVQNSPSTVQDEISRVQDSQSELLEEASNVELPSDFPEKTDVQRVKSESALESENSESQIPQSMPSTNAPGACGEGPQSHPPADR